MAPGGFGTTNSTRCHIAWMPGGKAWCGLLKVLFVSDQFQSLSTCFWLLPHAFDCFQEFSCEQFQLLSLLKSLQEMGEKDKEQNPTPAGIYTKESVGKVTWWVTWWAKNRWWHNQRGSLNKEFWCLCKQVMWPSKVKEMSNKIMMSHRRKSCDMVSHLQQIRRRCQTCAHMLQWEPPAGLPLEELKCLSHLFQGELNLLFISFHTSLTSCPMSTNGESNFFATSSVLGEVWMFRVVATGGSVRRLGGSLNMLDPGQ